MALFQARPPDLSFTGQAGGKTTAARQYY